MHQRRLQKGAYSGFTMIEVALTVTIIGILAIVALPNFGTMSDQAHTASRRNVASSVQDGVQMWRSQDIVTNGPPGNYPAALDGVANSTACLVSSPCFGTVLMNAVADQRWTKVSAIQYTYNASGTIYTFNYDTTTGTFTEQ